MLLVLNPDLIENDLLLCMPIKSWTLLFFFINCNAEIESQTILCSGGYQAKLKSVKSKAENAEKNSNHEVCRKMFCLVGITYTSPKVSVTASKRVPREREGGGGGGI